MACYIAFLRGINVGGNNKIPMAELREMCEGIGLTDVKTVLQSGNLIFDAGRHKSSDIAKTLERETAKRFGVSIDFMVRSGEELAAIVKANPFPAEARSDPGHLLVLFLKGQAAKGAEEELRKAIKGREVVLVRGQEAYATYPDSIGTSKLTNVILERKLGTRVTGRNWNTVLKMLELAKDM